VTLKWLGHIFRVEQGQGDKECISGSHVGKDQEIDQEKDV